MRKLYPFILGLLLFVLLPCSLLYAQPAPCIDKREFTYTDNSQKTILINEFLIWSKADNKFLPYTFPADKFHKKGHEGGPPLGVRFFNFGCMKTKRDGTFRKGQVCKDPLGHAVFKSPVFGIRGFIELAVIYINGGYNTPYAFFNRYAPASDCIGSVPRLPNGKCPNGQNNPARYAKKVADGLGIGIHDRIKIEDEEGKLSPRLFALLLAEVVRFETGIVCKFEDETIRLAIAEL